jgi:predicted transcriptional regulator
MRITKNLSYAINWLVSQNKKPEDIAEELDLTVKQVINYIEKNNIIGTGNDKLATKSSKVKSKSKDLMIRHTSNKKTNNVAIMTKEASEINDELKRKLNSNLSDKHSKYIFKPN